MGPDFQKERASGRVKGHGDSDKTRTLETLARQIP